MVSTLVPKHTRETHFRLPLNATCGSVAGACLSFCMCPLCPPLGPSAMVTGVREKTLLSSFLPTGRPRLQESLLSHTWLCSGAPFPQNCLCHPSPSVCCGSLARWYLSEALWMLEATEPSLPLPGFPRFPAAGLPS